MKALDCKRVGDSELGHWCEVHQFGWLSDVDSCPRAESVAAAVVAAVQGPIKAEGVREAEFEIRDSKTLPIVAKAAVCAVLRGRAG